MTTKQQKTYFSYQQPISLVDSSQTLRQLLPKIDHRNQLTEETVHASPSQTHKSK